MHIEIVGVPMDLGAGRRGMDMGPSAIRLAGLRQRLESLGFAVRDRGNLVVGDRVAIDAGTPKARHRLRDPRGFALQSVYTADRTLDETVAVHDGELVLVPRGFHTVSAAPGYDLYYLNVMAGPLRSWKVTFDDAHAWLRG